MTSASSKTHLTIIGLYDKCSIYMYSQCKVN